MDADAELENQRQELENPCNQRQEQHEEQPLEDPADPDEQQIQVGVWLADLVLDLCNLPEQQLQLLTRPPPQQQQQQAQPPQATPDSTEWR